MWVLPGTSLHPPLVTYAIPLRNSIVGSLFSAFTGNVFQLTFTLMLSSFNQEAISLC